MILNILNNNRILKKALNIILPDLTVLTGENGSGKTQLLEYIRNHPMGRQFSGNMGELYTPSSSILCNNEGVAFTRIFYTLPGLRSGDFEPQPTTGTTLLHGIKAQWGKIKYPILAYGQSCDNLTGNENDDLTAINAAITEMANSLIHLNQQQRNGTINLLNINDVKQIKTLAEKSKKSLKDLSLPDMIIFYDLPLNLFSASLDLLFHQFYLKQKHYPHLTKDERSPRDVFNEILINANFKYRAEYTESMNDEILSPVKLVDINNGSQVSFDQLSSGETTIMALIFVLYNSSNNGFFPEVILFDEPDAHLHPSLTQTFLDVIQNVLIQKHRVKVIITSHSPSTVALSPEESIYLMNRELGRPVKSDKRTALSTLSNGLASMTIEESSLGISYNIKKVQKHILFTEGITDKIILEIAWKKLYPNKEADFFIQDCFDATFLSNLFSRGNDKPDGIFHQFPDKKMIALFDLDRTGYNKWNGNKKRFSVTIEEDPKKGLANSNGKNGIILLLPVPEIPEIIKQVIKEGNVTYKDDSFLTIESLLFNVEQLKKFFEKQSLPGGGTVNVIKDNFKRELATTIETLPPEDFVFFTPLFKIIERCINQIS